MREIKFRAWDKSEERMVYSGTKQNDYPFVWQIHNTGIEIVEHDGTNWNTIKDLVFMQYTGLKDKNGKEIYEGDIVEYKSIYEWEKQPIKKAKVVFENGMFCPPGVIMDLSRSEIIGNIYENPELLIWEVWCGHNHIIENYGWGKILG